MLFRSDPGSFVGLAVCLWRKCDPSNRLRFAQAFPEIAEVCEEWYATPGEDDFFKKYSVGRFA
jgi:hypothetical protein